MYQDNALVAKDKMNGPNIIPSNRGHGHDFQYNVTYLSIQIFIAN